MPGHPIFGAMANGPHQQVDALQAAKRPLDFRQTLVAAYRVFRREARDGFAGAQHINPIELRFLIDGILAATASETPLADLTVKVLTHLVAAQDLTHFQPDLRRREWLVFPPRHVLGDLRQTLLRSLEK